MTDQEAIRELICKVVAMAMERIQQGKYNPPTPEELGPIKAKPVDVKTESAKIKGK